MSKVDDIPGKRIILRSPKIEDWEAICFLRSDPEVNLYVNRPPAKTKKESVAFINKIIDFINSGASYYWCIIALDTGKLMGTICLWNFSDDQRTAEVGYDLMPEYQGKGYMNEALKLVLTFGLQQLKLRKIEAYTHRQNSASSRLLEKNGFSLNASKKDPENSDIIIYELKTTF